MPIQKYNTPNIASMIQMSNTTTLSDTATTANSSYEDRRDSSIQLRETISLTGVLMKPSSSSNSSSCSSPPSQVITNDDQIISHNLTDKMTSLKNLVPNIIEASNNHTNIINTPTSLPVEIKTRLHMIFSQIENEFDALYADNVRLQQKLYNNSFKSANNNNNNNNNTNQFNSTSSSSTLVPSNTSPIKNNKSQLENSNSQSITHTSSLLNSVITNIVQSKLTDNKPNTALNTIKPTSAALAANTFSKNRINNLSFPKFRPNAREFIMQSIKNTSAQIVNKTQSSHASSSLTTKHQHTLSGHRDGIWDISCLPIPGHLFNSNDLTNYPNNHNLLIGTASADSTARLWYLNAHSNSSSRDTLVSHLSSSPQTPSTSINNNNNNNNNNNPGSNPLQTNGFCIQHYCGHTGSVNSIRFHPKFFTEATNLILTASGDSQAHIWQCVLSPVNDSLESTSEVVLNYNNCYSFATNSQYNSFNGFGSPPPLSHLLSSPASQVPPTNYKELISNTPVIRSPIMRYEGHTDVCIAADWFPDGELLATASWDRSANVYNVETGKVLCTLQHDDMLTNVNIHTSQKIILTSSKDTTFKVWDFRDPICSVNVYQGHNRSVNSAIFVNDDKIATSSDDQTVKLWDLRIMRSPVATISPNSGINRLCTMPTESDTFICLPLDNRDVKVYNLQGERVLRMPRTNRIGHQRLVTSLTCYKNLLISASFDKNVNIWSVDPVHSKSINSIGTTSSGATNKLNFSNKENNTNEMNTPVNKNNGLIPNEKSLINSCPPAQNNNNNNNQEAASPPQKRMNSSFYESPLILAHITNNTGPSVKSVNATLTKIAERIKI